VAESLELSSTECELLLRAGVAGRIAVSTPNGPHIVPVNYSVVDDAIVVRTSAYSLLGTHGRNVVLAFEVDHVDHAQQHGWSVQARGRSEVVTGADDLEHIRTSWAPRPWAAGTRNLFLRIPWNDLTGRRLGLGWSLEEESPVLRRLSS
jgi:nitroimidazol reductase NimA-like FMN-containing flavoprotein (pyridoxamine 5'-phosphate oxidase superfamily)